MDFLQLVPVTCYRGRPLQLELDVVDLDAYVSADLRAELESANIFARPS